MSIEEPALHRTILLANFPKHPSDRLVNEVVTVVKEQRRYGQGVLELGASNEVGGRDDGNAAFPE